MLIAARDELGLYTKDATLREWTPDANGNSQADALGKPALLMQMHMTAGAQTATLEIFTLGPARTQIESASIPAQRENGWVSIPQALEKIEPLSRGDFPDQLKKLGFTRQSQPKSAENVPAGVDKLLYGTTLFAPYSALQQVHAAIQRGGESPQLLSSLVRGYANLGQLTRFQWSSIHCILTARSLLYAQRLVCENPDSPLAYFTRAYAYALTGLHAAALADLDRAKQCENKLAAAGKPVLGIPKWAEVLDPFCKCDLQRLAEFGPKSDPRAALVSLLLFVDVENCGSLCELMSVGDAALKVDPRCFRIIDGMTQHGGVISNHKLTVLAPETMFQILPDEIKLLKVVPQTVQRAIDQASGNEDPFANLQLACQSLVTAPDPAEPSFTLGGRILEETNFMHVMRRAYFMAHQWGVDASDYVNQAEPLFKGHPYAVFIEGLKRNKGPSFDAEMRSLQIVDPRWKMLPMIVSFSEYERMNGGNRATAAWNRMLLDPDATACDAESMLLPNLGITVNASLLKAFAPRILAISPYSALAAGTIVKTNFAAAKPHMAEWDKQFAGQPAYLAAVAEYWLLQKQPEKAEPVLKQLVDVAPDMKPVEKLADIYLEKNDEQDWLKTMKLVLAQPDYALDHSYVEAVIAWHYMGAGQYDTARSYADASYAQSGSAWSMQCDEFAAEYQGDYAGCEKVVRDEAQRYSPTCWFFWCKRSGHGDLASAQKLADEWAAEHPSNNPSAIAQLRYLEGRTDLAKTYYDHGMRRTHSCLDAIQLALICAEQKDFDGRDSALDFADKNCRVSLLADHLDYTAYARYAQLLKTSRDKAPSQEQVDAILAGCSPHQRTGIYYFQGRELQLIGDIDGAKKSYQSAIQQPSLFSSISTSSSYVLACDALHKLGEKTPLPPAPSKKPAD